jgi:hypothetical protein
MDHSIDDIRKGKTMNFAGLLLVTFTAAAAMPAWGQAGLPSDAAPNSGHTQSATSVTDLSGVWTKPYLGVEPPSSGPGPVTNKFRTPQQGARGTLVSSFTRLVGDYTNPILKPDAAELVRNYGEIESHGMPHASARNQCWPEGVPAILYNIAMELLQQPDKIILVYANDHQVRFVRMNQPHPAQVMPSWYGDSVGHYEGDTLVIDTVGIRVGPLSMIDFFGTPFTNALHVVERYALSAARLRSRQGRVGKGRQGEFARPQRLQPRLQGQAPPASIHGRG